YDHESPKAGFLYALPETPPAYLPDNWEERVKQAGALVFKATPDRAATLVNLKATLGAEGAATLGWKQGLDLRVDDLGPFFGLGWGHLLLAALSEAMEHENLLDVAAFWDDVQQAVALLGGFPYTPMTPANPDDRPQDLYEVDSPAEYDQPARTGPASESTIADDSESPVVDASTSFVADASRSVAPGADASEALVANAPGSPSLPGVPIGWRAPLKSAAAKFLAAREVLYPVKFHFLDVSFLDETTRA